MLIDGGKGQLEAAIRARDETGQKQVPFIGLAKREEQIVIQKNKSSVKVIAGVLQKLGGFATENQDFILINLPHNTNLVKLLQRIRDESHRFAVSYHSTLKTKRQTSSSLDDLPGIGPGTRKKLIKKFGSLRALGFATPNEIAEVVGVKKAKMLSAYLAEAPSSKSPNA